MSRSAAALDLVTRVALFVLAAVAALAIVGAIAAIPGDVARNLARQADGAAREGAVATSQGRIAGQPLDPADARRRVGDDRVTGTGPPVAAPVVGAPERIADWLEVIAYTLIANAGLMALFGLALLRRR